MNIIPHMIERYEFGQPVVDTGAVVMDVAPSIGEMPFGVVESRSPLKFKCGLSRGEMVFGLGENVRGINKRGFRYVSWCSDHACAGENDSSLYGAHNFLIISGSARTVGLFFDTPSRVEFDVGWTRGDELVVSCDEDGIDVYVITSEEKRKECALKDIVRQFRRMVGRSYIPPLWAFGFQQSRWGYKTEADVRAVVENYRSRSLPLDSVCLDIDYMEGFRDFTVSKERFPEFAALNKSLAEEGIHLVPIIDAGVKAEDGFGIYDEGRAGGFFCTTPGGDVFKAGVWPGLSAFTDFMREDARAWFGSKYKALVDCGVEGFWNDMNEPSLFYTDDGLKAAFRKIDDFRGRELDIDSFFDFTSVGGSMSCRLEDYRNMIHEVAGPDGSKKSVPHARIHNIYGAMMTRASGEGLSAILPGKRTLLYSRSSCIGAHRYGGIWMGDNCSKWGDIELEMRMLPSLNMCGFMYTGADIGGFGDSSSRDLVLRWLALGVFVPLMRNHSAWNTRMQECYAFDGGTEDFRSVLSLRYALIPYIYSEFVKACDSGDMMFRPLCFDYPEDEIARSIEDELIVGNEVLIAPVCRQNAEGRLVYLPEDMTQVVWKNCRASESHVGKGVHYIDVPEDTVVFFIKRGKSVPICGTIAQSTDKIDYGSLVRLGDDVPYSLYRDDGFTTDIDVAANTVELWA